MNDIEKIVNLNNYLADFCRQYSKEHGDCYDCPIGKRIKEYCKVDGLLRWLQTKVMK